MPDRLRFAVTLPRRIMRERRFAQAQRRLRQFLGKVAGLGPTPGPPLIQLPPSLRFDPDTSAGFLRAFWDIHTGRIVYEPRHGSWFAHNVDALLTELCIARVAADPAPVPGVRASGGWHGLRDNRLHDSPKIYRSAHPPGTPDALAGRLTIGPPTEAGSTWCSAAWAFPLRDVKSAQDGGGLVLGANDLPLWEMHPSAFITTH